MSTNKQISHFDSLPWCSSQFQLRSLFYICTDAPPHCSGLNQGPPRAVFSSSFRQLFGGVMKYFGSVMCHDWNILGSHLLALSVDWMLGSLQCFKSRPTQPRIKWFNSYGNNLPSNQSLTVNLTLPPLKRPKLWISTRKQFNFEQRANKWERQCKRQIWGKKYRLSWHHPMHCNAMHPRRDSGY